MSHPMAGISPAKSGNWVTSLRGFLNEPEARLEHCELCNTEIGRDHAHLLDSETGHLVCSCTPCALLFTSREAKHYRRVPTQVERLRGFELSDTRWDTFLIPIGLAFFVHSSKENRVRVLYPGPAGATESTLNIRSWKELFGPNPILERFEPDVEALLVNRIGETRACFRVPIDLCYELVGLIRIRWHGLSGGEDVQDAIRNFFAQLDEEAIDAHRGSGNA